MKRKEGMNVNDLRVLIHDVKDKKNRQVAIDLNGGRYGIFDLHRLENKGNSVLNFSLDHCLGIFDHEHL